MLHKYEYDPDRAIRTMLSPDLDPQSCNPAIFFSLRYNIVQFTLHCTCSALEKWKQLYRDEIKIPIISVDSDLQE